MADQIPVVLTIAGSDPSGGAGIQADLKTFTVLGVYGAAAITALTVQNTMGVSECFPVDPVVVRKQIVSVLNDLRVTHVKIGMIGSVDVAEAVADTLADFQGEVVCDPVRISSSGADLLSGSGVSFFWKKLIKRATVLTPNRQEIELLAEKHLAKGEDALDAAKELFDTFPRLRAICLTGGHFPDTNRITDYLLRRDTHGGGPGTNVCLFQSVHNRVDTKNLHGTGCTFASAFTAYHSVTHDDVAAFTKTSDFMDHLIKAGATAAIGRGTGPLLHHLWNIKGRSEGQ